MAELNLQLWIGVPLGIGSGGTWEYNWLPDETAAGFRVSYFAAMNTIALSNNESINNEFEVGDKLRQAASQGSLAVGIADGHFKSKLRAIYNGRQKFLAALKTEIISSDYIQKSATLIMPFANFTVLSADEARIGFSPKFAKIEFSSLNFSQVVRQADKLMSNAASSVKSAVGSVRF